MQDNIQDERVERLLDYRNEPRPRDEIQQLDKTNACINIETPGKCMAKCKGYDFYIGETHYQKCKFGCFQFDVDEESIPFLLELLKRELEERRAE